MLLNSNCFLKLNRELRANYWSLNCLSAEERSPQKLLLPTLNFAHVLRGHKLFLRRRKGKEHTFREYREGRLARSILPSSPIFSKCVTKGVQHLLCCHVVHAAFCPFCSGHLQVSRVAICCSLETFCSFSEACRMGFDKALLLWHESIKFTAGSIEISAWEKLFSAVFLRTI